MVGNALKGALLSEYPFAGRPPIPSSKFPFAANTARYRGAALPRAPLAAGWLGRGWRAQRCPRAGNARRKRIRTERMRLTPPARTPRYAPPRPLSVLSALAPRSPPAGICVQEAAEAASDSGAESRQQAVRSCPHSCPLRLRASRVRKTRLLRYCVIGAAGRRQHWTSQRS